MQQARKLGQSRQQMMAREDHGGRRAGLHLLSSAGEGPGD